MKCPACTSEGKRSRVYPGVSSSTLMWCAPFYDEDGRYHHHDMNTTTTSFSCSKGHRWIESAKGSCSCGWSGGDLTITILVGESERPAS